MSSYHCQTSFQMISTAYLGRIQSHDPVIVPWHLQVIQRPSCQGSRMELLSARCGHPAYRWPCGWTKHSEGQRVQPSSSYVTTSASEVVSPLAVYGIHSRALRIPAKTLVWSDYSISVVHLRQARLATTSIQKVPLCSSGWCTPQRYIVSCISMLWDVGIMMRLTLQPRCKGIFNVPNDHFSQ